MQDKPNFSVLEEFLVHGLKYAFPAEHWSGDERSSDFVRGSSS
jgi:hypothetical protein